MVADEEDDEEPFRTQNHHHPEILQDRTNAGSKPWTGSTSKKADSGKHISYDSMDEERNVWGSH